MNHRSAHFKKRAFLPANPATILMIDQQSTTQDLVHYKIEKFASHTCWKETWCWLFFFFLHFSLENIDLFNPNDQGNWSAWAAALLQYATSVRTIHSNSSENSPFKKKKIYFKWNELMNKSHLQLMFLQCTVWVLWSISSLWEMTVKMNTLLCFFIYIVLYMPGIIAESMITVE